MKRVAERSGLYPTPLAAVSTRVGWPLDAIEHNRNGYLVPVGDASALADAAPSCLELSDPAWKAKSDRAYRTARCIDWTRSCKEFTHALEVACELKPGGGQA